MRAVNLFSGSRAVRRAPLPLATASPGTEADPGEASAVPEVGLRYLSGTETAEVLKRARDFAISKGLADPKEDDELYQYGKAAWTAYLGCVDPDDPKTQFFDSFDQLLKFCGRDEILLLAELQEQWQQECSPLKKDFEEGELSKAIDLLAGPAGSAFFLSLRPGLRWSLARSMAVLLRSSQLGRWQSGLRDTPESEPEKTEQPISERSPSTRQPRIRVKPSHWRWQP